MTHIMIVLPIFCFLAFFILFASRSSKIDPPADDISQAFIQSALLWGILAVLLSEGLSLLSILTSTAIAIAWGVILITAVFLIWRNNAFEKFWSMLKANIRKLEKTDYVLMGCFGIIVLLLWIIAWFSPPNNVDSQLYHMSRVVHWAQNNSLSHYPTAYEHQIWQPIWAENAILHLWLLWGDDQPANLVQWFSMVGSLIVVSGIAGLLGANRRGQWIAAAFAFSLPIGILQSTSTQNDYVTAFWLLCLIYFVVLHSKRKLAIVEKVGLASSLALGFLTKGTFYPYAAAIGIWAVIIWIVRKDYRDAILNTVLIVLTVLLINLGYWIRNIKTYAGPLGSMETINRMTDMRHNVVSGTVAIVKDIALNFATPEEDWNEEIIRNINALEKLSGQDEGEFDLEFVWNLEDLAGNPIQMLFVPSAIWLAFLLRKRIQSPKLKAYILTVCLSYALLALVIHFDYYGVRYQLPFFIAWAPVVGVVGGQLKQRYAVLITFGFLIVSMPWVLFNRTRPLIGLRPRTTSQSIFRTPAAELLFANWIERRDPSIAAAEKVKSIGCKEVGLQLDSHDWEYSFWWLLNAPQSGIRIEVLNMSPALEQYRDPEFQPCAIICTICSNPNLYGLELLAFYSDVRVYSGDSFNLKEP